MNEKRIVKCNCKLHLPNEFILKNVKQKKIKMLMGHHISNPQMSIIIIHVKQGASKVKKKKNQIFKRLTWLF